MPCSLSAVYWKSLSVITRLATHQPVTSGAYALQDIRRILQEHIAAKKPSSSSSHSSDRRRSDAISERDYSRVPRPVRNRPALRQNPRGVRRRCLWRHTFRSQSAIAFLFRSSGFCSLLSPVAQAREILSVVARCHLDIAAKSGPSCRENVSIAGQMFGTTAQMPAWLLRNQARVQVLSFFRGVIFLFSLYIQNNFFWAQENLRGTAPEFPLLATGLWPQPSCYAEHKWTQQTRRPNCWCLVDLTSSQLCAFASWPERSKSCLRRLSSVSSLWQFKLNDNFVREILFLASRPCTWCSSYWLSTSMSCQHRCRLRAGKFLWMPFQSSKPTIFRAKGPGPNTRSNCSQVAKEEEGIRKCKRSFSWSCNILLSVLWMKTDQTCLLSEWLLFSSFCENFQLGLSPNFFSVLAHTCYFMNSSVKTRHFP